LTFLSILILILLEYLHQINLMILIVEYVLYFHYLYRLLFQMDLNPQELNYELMVVDLNLLQVVEHLNNFIFKTIQLDIYLTR